jgi:hypothetical protein
MQPLAHDPVQDQCDEADCRVRTDPFGQPVVNRADLRKLEGVVSEHDVLNRYRDFGEG